MINKRNKSKFQQNKLNVKKLRIKSYFGLILTLFLMFFSQARAVAVEKSLCVYDPVGANGPIFNQMRDYRTAAVGWGIQFELKPYTDERVAAEDFKSAVCDAVVLTGFRAREFNSFTGSLDAIGALPSYRHVKALFQTLSGPKAAKLMRNGPYEVIGLMPAGAAFLFVNDRNIDTVSELSGKRIGVLESDESQKEMAVNVGGSPVSSNITSLYSKFNNGSVDVVAGPAVLYEAMELYKGLEPRGGLIAFPMGQLSLQMIIRSEKFAPEFGQSSRDYALEQFDVALEILKSSEENIPEKWWIEIPAEDRTGYVEMLRQARINLKKKDIYNGKTLTVMRKVRCKLDPKMAECTAVDKE